jgi:hypothetical protein
MQKVEAFPMAPRIAGHSIEPSRSLSANDLRRAFDTAISELHAADLAARKRLQYRTPIVQRGENMEKRALTDAARALAQLWKV